MWLVQGPNPQPWCIGMINWATQQGYSFLYGAENCFPVISNSGTTHTYTKSIYSFKWQLILCGHFLPPPPLPFFLYSFSWSLFSRSEFSQLFLSLNRCSNLSSEEVPGCQCPTCRAILQEQTLQTGLPHTEAGAMISLELGIKSLFQLFNLRKSSFMKGARHKRLQTVLPFMQSVSMSKTNLWWKSESGSAGEKEGWNHWEGAWGNFLGQLNCSLFPLGWWLMGAQAAELIESIVDLCIFLYVGLPPWKKQLRYFLYSKLSFFPLKFSFHLVFIRQQKYHKCISRRAADNFSIVSKWSMPSLSCDSTFVYWERKKSQAQVIF